MAEKYIDLIHAIEDSDSMVGCERVTVDAVLDWLDRNPDQVPGRTITESEVELAVAEVFGSDWRAEEPCKVLLERLGITLAPDPEPKPTIEFAREIMRFESGDPDVMSIPHWAVNMAMHLMDAGYVKAPGGDDEH